MSNSLLIITRPLIVFRNSAALLLFESASQCWREKTERKLSRTESQYLQQFRNTPVLVSPKSEKTQSGMSDNRYLPVPRTRSSSQYNIVGLTKILWTWNTWKTESENKDERKRVGTKIPAGAKLGWPENCARRAKFENFTARCRFGEYPQFCYLGIRQSVPWYSLDYFFFVFFVIFYVLSAFLFCYFSRNNEFREATDLHGIISLPRQYHVPIDLHFVCFQTPCQEN